MAKKTNLTASKMSKLLRTNNRHGNKKFMLLKFEDSELIKQLPRNPAGNSTVFKKHT